MPVKIRLAVLTTFCLALTALPAWGGSWSYENGPINGNVDAWTINFGFTVSDSYLAAGTSVNGFEFGVRELPGDRMNGVDWILSTGPCSDPGSGCGTIVGFGTANSSNLTDQFLSRKRLWLRHRPDHSVEPQRPGNKWPRVLPDSG